MRLRSLFLPQYKNLSGFRLPYTEDEPARNSTLRRDVPVLMILGRNGSGKSNLLEALLIIFRDLDLGRRSGFPYRLEYECGEHHVTVDCLDGRDSIVATPRSPDVGSSTTFTRRQFATDEIARSLRPSHVFGYYSGQSERFAELFATHHDRFYRALLDSEDPPLRPMFLARPSHSLFVLIAFFSDPAAGQAAQRFKFLREELGIEGLDSILFVLHNPPWEKKREAMQPAEAALRDWRFWGARGTVKGFLGALFESSTAPMTLPAPRGFGKRELKFLYLRGEHDLHELRKRSGARSAAEFFAMLESTDISDVLHDVRIRVRVRGVDGSLTFRELSEGEQQLLTVLGLIEFTREGESLFLLDEPDTHLNPAWGMRYTELLRAQLGDDAERSQVLVATHDPLAIADLGREAVVVLDSEPDDHMQHAHGADARRIVARHPDVDPQGLGVAGILTSDMFGLKTTIDPTTMSKIDRRLELWGMTDRSQVEQAELARLTAELGALGFNYEHSDPYQAAFGRALSRRFREIAGLMTAADRERLEREADQLLAEILDGERDALD